MTSPLPDPATADPHEHLNRRYLYVRERYDRRATQYKRRRVWLWFVTLVATWSPLVFAIVGLSGRLPAEWNTFILHSVIPSLGTLNVAVTAVQVVTSPRGQWLEYRAATERLREQAMLFRAGLAPYAAADAEAEFGNLLDRMTDRLGEDDPDFATRRNRSWLLAAVAAAAFWRSAAWRMFVGRLSLAVRGLPPALRAAVAHPPDDGLFPRLSELTPAEKVALVRSRLLNQRLWHLRKAGRYYSLYLSFQALTASLAAFITIYSYFLGRSFFWYGAATATSLSLMAWRDFLECAPLSMRYFQLAKSLEELEARLTHLEHAAEPGSVSDHDLAQVVDAGERLIGGEFRSWKLVHEVLTTD